MQVLGVGLGSFLGLGQFVWVGGGNLGPSQVLFLVGWTLLGLGQGDWDMDLKKIKTF